MADEMSAAHGALLEHFQARDFDQAIVDAERVLSLAGSTDVDPQQRSLVFGASAMWLQMQAGRMAHKDLSSAAGEMFERFAGDEAPEAVVAASVAATVAIQTLLTIGQKDAAERQAVALERLYRARPTTLNEQAIAKQLLLSAYTLLLARLAAPAAALARAVVEHAEDDDQLITVTAAARVWLLIATVYSGATGVEIPDEDQIRSMSVDELRELSPAVTEAEKLDAMGRDGVRAIDTALTRLQRQGQWDRALLTLLSLKVEMVSELGEPDELRGTLQQGIDICSGIKRWHGPEVVQTFRNQLAEL